MRKESDVRLPCYRAVFQPRYKLGFVTSVVVAILSRLSLWSRAKISALVDELEKTTRAIFARIAAQYRSQGHFSLK
jgi:hypothetical protein